VINWGSVSSAPAGYRFPREVIAVAVRWYLRYGLSYRDVEELLAERGIEVDHATIYRWVQRFTCEFIDSGRRARHAVASSVVVILEPQILRSRCRGLVPERHRWAIGMLPGPHSRPG
jgi:transposase-like protein